MKHAHYTEENAHMINTRARAYMHAYAYTHEHTRVLVHIGVVISSNELVVDLGGICQNKHEILAKMD